VDWALGLFGDFGGDFVYRCYLMSVTQRYTLIPRLFDNKFWENFLD
jgi:hypothetical protein